MGRIRANAFSDGFTYIDDKGKRTRYTRRVFGDGFRGSDGSTIMPKVIGSGYVVRKPDGTKETFHKSILGTGLHGSKGTSITPDILGPGATVRRRKH